MQALLTTSELMAVFTSLNDRLGGELEGVPFCVEPGRDFCSEQEKVPGMRCLVWTSGRSTRRSRRWARAGKLWRTTASTWPTTAIGMVIRMNHMAGTSTGTACAAGSSVLRGLALRRRRPPRGPRLPHHEVGHRLLPGNPARERQRKSSSGPRPTTATRRSGPSSLSSS